MSARFVSVIKGRSIFSIIRYFQRQPLEYAVNMRRDYGDVVHLPGLPGLDTYLFYHPDDLHDLLVKHASKLVKPALLKQIFKSSFGNGLFFSEGDFWRRQRKLAQPAFHHGRIGAYDDRMVAHTLKTLDRWRTDDIRDIEREMHALTLTIVVDALFHTDVSGLTERVADAMLDLGSAIQEQATSPLKAVVPDWFPTSFTKRKQHGVNVINEIIFALLKERRASGEDTGDLLSMFLLAQDEETGERMSDAQIRDEVMTMFIAGHETTAVTLTWAWLELSRNSQIEAALRSEIETVLGDRPPTTNDLASLPYTQAVIKEILRLYPPAWILLRQTTEDIEVGDYRVPKGAILHIMPYAVQRDPRWFSEPDRFMPERWFGESHKNLPKFAYFPFGGGPRICIGNGFAMMEASLLLATIAQRYSLSLEEHQPVAIGATISPGSVHMKLHAPEPVKI